MLSRFVFDPTELPTAIWQLFFHNCELHYQNELITPMLVKLRSGGTVKRVIINQYTYLEQNPDSPTEWGRLAKSGKKILWIKHFPTNRYVGKVVDGKVTQIR